MTNSENTKQNFPRVLTKRPVEVYEEDYDDNKDGPYWLQMLNALELAVLVIGLPLGIIIGFCLFCVYYDVPLPGISTRY